ncbi:MAG: hypothetical protein LAN63_03560 [Acidobacteriia bacterium]|nr:hypothetical protein [Terriglobia bacterium]
MAHYRKGVHLGTPPNIQPLCKDGNTPPCLAGQGPAEIVFLFIGFSNCDIEICGGNSDAWDGQDHNPALFQHHLAGQPCATYCPNLNNPNTQRFPVAWNQVKGGDQNVGGDGVTQQSFLYQIYGGQTRLVGPDVVVFNGALGAQTLDKWDPTPYGYYAQHNDCQSGQSHDPECNYNRVMTDLQANGYSEAQVQAIFVKSADPYPQCDLKRLYCPPGDPTFEPDAYIAEAYLGDIMRYLKCCELDDNGNSTGIPRYPHLQQIFITSRIYGGYANGSPNGCLNPEPFAYELSFAVQRLILAQINATPDPYSGDVSYNSAPWFDWGPYLWASGVNISSGNQLNWCDSTTRSDFRCANNLGDVRYGDLDQDYTQYFGDHTHPTFKGQLKVATQLVEWIQGNLPMAQSFLSDWVRNWIGQ